MALGKSASSRMSATGYSVVDQHLTIHGNLDTEGTVRVSGRVEGTSHRAGTLIIGIGGCVVGDVQAREVVVGGTLHGNIDARARVEIDAAATVHGDVHAETMLLHEGGTVNGHVAVGTVAPAAAPSATATRRLALTPAASSPAVARG